MDAFKVLFISIRIVPIPTFTFTTRQHAQNSTACFQFFRGNFMYAMYWEEKLKASYIYWVPEYKSTFWLCPAVYGIILCWFYYYSNFFTFMYGTLTEMEQRDWWLYHFLTVFFLLKCFLACWGWHARYTQL